MSIDARPLATIATRPRGVDVRRAILPVCLALALGLLVWSTVARAVLVWTWLEEFSYGFLILPIAVVLVWVRRRELLSSIGSGANGGLVIVVASLVLFVGANRIGVHALAGFAVSPLLWGVAVYLWGWKAGRILAFPFFFLAFGLTLYRGLLYSAGFALQDITSVGAAILAQALGVPIIRNGTTLQSDQFAFVVAEECSGMSSLLSLLALAAVWLYLVRGSLASRLSVMISVLPLVILANAMRVTLVLLVAFWFGQDAALGFFHGASSLVLFGLALAGLLLVSRMVGCKAPSPVIWS
jgi:exosortase